MIRDQHGSSGSPHRHEKRVATVNQRITSERQEKKKSTGQPGKNSPGEDTIDEETGGMSRDEFSSSEDECNVDLEGVGLLTLRGHFGESLVASLTAEEKVAGVEQVQTLQGMNSEVLPIWCALRSLSPFPQSCFTHAGGSVYCTSCGRQDRQKSTWMSWNTRVPSRLKIHQK